MFFLLKTHLLEYEIHDLMANEESCFQKEVASWTTDVTAPDSLMYSDCAGNFVIGGFRWSPQTSQANKRLQRSYKDLPEHKYIRFSFKFWAMDSWDSQYDSSQPYDHFRVQFDSLPVFNGFNMRQNQFGGSSLCGHTGYRDFPDGRVYGWIEHSSPSVLLSFISRMSSRAADESFGMREVKLLFTNSTPTGRSYCAYTRTIPIYFQTPCTCETGQYSMTSSSSGCTGCHEDCESCFGFGADKCFACASGRYFDGEKCVNLLRTECINFDSSEISIFW